jgi:iron complex outermembrane receptor protein
MKSSTYAHSRPATSGLSVLGPSKLRLAIMLVAVAAQSQVHAQAAEEDLEEVVITGSRIRTTGMETPNPITVVTREEIDILSPTTMVEGLAELPQFFGSNTTQNTGGFFTSAGAGSLNLRGLNSKRTLQLLNARRVVPSTIFGGPDINLFPENVIRTVETVTGGATAAYGTDAVAGVVNFMLDTSYTGFRGRVQGGENKEGHNQNHEISLGGGFALGARTHVLLNFEKAEQDPIWGEDVLDYDWYRQRSLIENPDTAGRGTTPENPFFLPATRVRSRLYDADGIFHLPANAGGPQILDQSGNPSPFILGDLCNAHGCQTLNNGSGKDSGVNALMITPESGRENYFGYIEHELTDQLSVFGQAIVGEATFTQKGNTGLFANAPGAVRGFTIFRGNPFLPAPIQQAMVTNNLASVVFSRIGQAEDIGIEYTEQTTETTSLTGGFKYAVEGGFFNDWEVNGYYQVGETDVEAIQHQGIRLDRIYLAMDVVSTPSGPRCNVTVVSGLYPDCVPLNLFGRGKASPAALDWVTGFEPGVPMTANGFLSATESIPHSYTSTDSKHRIISLEQDVWEISADGKIHDGWGAGAINMAVGYGWREESFVQLVRVGPGGNVDTNPAFRPVAANNAALGIRGVPGGALASGNSVEIQFSNVPHARGKQDVSEAFMEYLIPLISGKPLLQQLNFTAATRWASYSGSGDVWSWKGGFDWTITDEVRLRSTISQDVRAATMGEKFDRTGGIGNVTDFLANPAGGSDVTYGITTFSNGTPDIRPEEAKTMTVGLVYQPDWLDGLSLSGDWYTVEVKDNINQVTPAQVVTGCYQNNDVDLCQFISRTGDPITTVTGTTIPRISLVGVPFFNQASVKASGVDFEAVYRTDVDWLGGGESLNVRALGSYLRERSNTSSAGVKTEIQGVFGQPEWTAVLSGTYMRGPLSVSLIGRYTEGQMLNQNWNHNGTSTRWDVFNNRIGSIMEWDARVGYSFEVANTNLNVFATINNLSDKDPQEALLGAFSAAFSSGTGLGTTGDQRGRRYVVGLSFDF